MLNAQCSFLHFIPTLSEIPSKQILKQSPMIKLSTPTVKQATISGPRNLLKPECDSTAIYPNNLVK